MQQVTDDQKAAMDKALSGLPLDLTAASASMSANAA
jgi:hypothetical protein